MEHAGSLSPTTPEHQGVGTVWRQVAVKPYDFRLTKTGRFNGEYTDKPLLISSSSVAFYISNYNSFEITKQIEPNVVSLSVYFMSESLVCYVAKFVFIMKKSAYENKIFR
ncbi:hypothetical protein DWX40_12890 [Bacteroides stercoris]|nr:hypothetical protein DWX40_12890 [Bacteroides stercoris]